jgi:phospholipid/cholesterol/gamma-HCH transport system substrate-binding protein
MADEDTRGRHRRQRQRTAFGLLIIGGLLGSVLLVFFLEDILAAFQQRYSLVAIVPDAEGIAPGTPVWLSGKPVGAVLSVAIRPATVDTLGRVAVVMDLPAAVQELIRGDSDVRVTSTGLMGETVLDIVPGTLATATLVPGDTIRASPTLSRDAVMAQASALRAGMGQLTAEARQVAPLLEARMTEARLAFAGMDAAMAEARRLQSDLQGNPGLARVRDTTFQASLARARAAADALPALVEGFQARAGEAGEIPVAAARLRARADTLAAQLEALAALLEEPAGSLGRLQQDPALTRAVEGARASLDSLMAEVRRNPLRFVF